MIFILVETYFSYCCSKIRYYIYDGFPLKISPRWGPFLFEIFFEAEIFSKNSTYNLWFPSHLHSQLSATWPHHISSSFLHAPFHPKPTFPAQKYRSSESSSSYCLIWYSRKLIKRKKMKLRKMRLKGAVFPPGS